ncbi:hypothetical protein WJX73_002184 [Symbiochloris irregularis]|uniref:Dehydroascorbate reductase n=1 Tax=Symbiochloris irregularis TaxID=706552 RepID=A0AAW1PI14_9CHLO
MVIKLPNDHELIPHSKRPLYDIYIKGSPEKGEVGDCPFSHRTMLHMEEKGISFNKMLIDEQNMPEWIPEVSEGNKKIPFMLELDTGKWLHDSDKIVPYLEKKFPDPKLGMPDDMPPDVGQELMPKCLIEFVTSKPGKEEDEKRQQLEAELKGINDHLAKGGPFFGGKDVNTHDLTLAPKLKHTILAGKEIKGWSMPKEFTAINKFMEEIAKRPSWKKTMYSDKYVQDGWQLKVKMLTQE